MVGNMALTIAAIKSLKKQGRHADGRNGLYLQISKTGIKSWIFRFTFDGKRKEMGLGHVENLSLAEARKKAAELNYQVKKDKIFNPIQERNKAKGEQIAQLRETVYTFEYCMNEFIALRKDSWTNAKHAQQWTNTLTTYALPFIGNLPADEIEVNHIIALLTPIWKTKTETATRVRNRIEQIIDYATACKYRTGENPARWRGHLDKILPKPSKVTKVNHFAALDYKLMPEFMATLRNEDYMSALALQFLILTVARTNPIICMEWHEIDFTEKTWTSPAKNMKTDKPHNTPLCNRAMEIINYLDAHRMGDYVFTGQSKAGNLSNAAMSKCLTRMGYGKYTVHGFRSSFRDWCGEETATPNFVAEMALAHSIGNNTESAYRRGDLLDKRRLLMNGWGDYLLNQ
jgi:integrase